MIDAVRQAVSGLSLHYREVVLLCHLHELSYNAAALAPDCIAATFGSNLASTTATANTVPLPATLAGTIAKVHDSLGVERDASFFFASQTQANLLLPTATTTGLAMLALTNGNGQTAANLINITPVAPGLFTADASGQGYPAAVVYRYRNNALVAIEPVARFDTTQNKIVAVPIDLGAETDTLFLVGFGTGLRYRSGLGGVSASIGGAAVEVLFAGAQGDLVGVDQINLRIPRTLAGRGDVDVILTVEGNIANAVKLTFK